MKTSRFSALLVLSLFISNNVFAFDATQMMGEQTQPAAEQAVPESPRPNPEPPAPLQPLAPVDMVPEGPLAASVGESPAPELAAPVNMTSLLPPSGELIEEEITDINTLISWDQENGAAYQEPSYDMLEMELASIEAMIASLTARLNSSALTVPASPGPVTADETMDGEMLASLDRRKQEEIDRRMLEDLQQRRDRLQNQLQQRRTWRTADLPNITANNLPAAGDTLDMLTRLRRIGRIDTPEYAKGRVVNASSSTDQATNITTIIIGYDRGNTGGVTNELVITIQANGARSARTRLPANPAPVPPPAPAPVNPSPMPSSSAPAAPVDAADVSGESVPAISGSIAVITDAPAESSPLPPAMTAASYAAISASAPPPADGEIIIFQGSAQDFINLQNQFVVALVAPSPEPAPMAAEEWDNEKITEITATKYPKKDDVVDITIAPGRSVEGKIIGEVKAPVVAGAKTTVVLPIDTNGDGKADTEMTLILEKKGDGVEIKIAVKSIK